MKRILFITGTRADFGKLKALIKKVKHSKKFEYQIFATGMHLLKKYGSTINEIKKSGFSNIHSFLNQDVVFGAQMDYVTANTINGLGLYIREFLPDLIVVHGDRVEALAGSIVGMLNNILVAHIEGGEVSGTVDETMRHAISKLSHIHFVTNEDAASRLKQMGEMPERIYVIGSPETDIMLSDDLPDASEVMEYYEIGFDEYGILAYHPVTTELCDLKNNINEIVEAVLESNHNFVVIYPNNDKGSETIFDAYKRLENNPRFRLLPSMRFESYLSLLRSSKVCIGNSSAGVREAPVYGVPTINLGTRQNKRNTSRTIININENKAKILEKLSNLPIALEPAYTFGKGTSAEMFLKSINDKNLWELSCQKIFNDA